MKKITLEDILATDNITAAFRHLKKSSVPGVDGINKNQLKVQIDNNWEEIRSCILKGTYRPQPVKRVEMTAAGGQ